MPHADDRDSAQILQQQNADTTDWHDTRANTANGDFKKAIAPTSTKSAKGARDPVGSDFPRESSGF